MFSKFELSLLLILVEEKILDIKMSLLNLEEEKPFLKPVNFEKHKQDITNAYELTNKLLNKIKKYLEE